MKAVFASGYKHHFGRSIDEVQEEPLAVKQHGCLVVVVAAAEEWERLTGQTVELSDKKREDKR